LVALAWSGLAHAAGKNPVAAQALYDEARQLAAANKFEQACPKFKASYDLDPAGGTLLNLADCYEHQGKTALAYTTFKDALDAARHDGKRERIDFANQHLAALEKKLARLSVVVPSEARTEGLQVTVDGAPLDDAAYGVALPVDPGTHLVRAEAPGKESFEKSIEVPTTSAKLSVEIPALTAVAAPAPAPAAAAAPAPSDEASPAPASSASSTKRTVGYIVGGAGIIAIGVGSYFGLRAIDRWGARNDACTGGCTPDAKTAGDEAQTAATISTVGFGVGIAALATGIALVLTSPSNKEGSARAGKLQMGVLSSRDGAGLSLRSNW
jgi:serine/threonine-protein kinase